MNTSLSPRLADAARGRRLVIPVALAAMAAAAAFAATLHHPPSHARDPSAQLGSSVGIGPGTAAFVDVSLPSASEAFARGNGAADEPCPTF